MAARARNPSGRIRAAPLTRANATLLDAFTDALWLEDGLSRNTISSYRADLSQFALFLDRDLQTAEEKDLFA